MKYRIVRVSVGYEIQKRATNFPFSADKFEFLLEAHPVVFGGPARRAYLTLWGARWGLRRYLRRQRRIGQIVYEEET